jgi:hypothetical protein
MEKINYRMLVLVLLMLIIVSIRVIAPLSPDFKMIANFSGIGAIALFGGAYLKNRLMGFLLPLFVLFLSDIGLVIAMGKDYGFYEGWYYTYISFILMVIIARLVIGKVNVPTVLGAGLLGVFIHWIVSDYGVWLGSTIYPQTIGGFWACLVAAIPYELNFLYGTIAYSAIMFAVFEGLTIKFPALSKVRVK